MRTAASLPVTDEFTGRGTDPAPGAVCRLAGFIESPELASLLALCLPVCWLDRHWEYVGPSPGVVLWLLADTIVFFFCDDESHP